METLFKNIPINSETKPLLEKFLEQYIIENPNFLTNYISKTGLYNVFFRECDEYCVDENTEFAMLYRARSYEICYIQSFTTFKEADEWILKMGKKIILEEENNRSRPIVLTIIHCKNEEYQGYAGEDPTHLYRLSGSKHPTYAFSETGFKMALHEHCVMFNREWCDESVPTWIQYINNNGDIIRSTKDARHADYMTGFPDFKEDEEFVSTLED
jgi:hypothetical protein